MSLLKVICWTFIFIVKLRLLCLVYQFPTYYLKLVAYSLPGDFFSRRIGCLEKDLEIPIALMTSSLPVDVTGCLEKDLETPFGSDSEVTLRTVMSFLNGTCTLNLRPSKKLKKC